MKIYTRTGDAGETSYFDGTRVRKDDPRIETYGDVDELNACLGLARATLKSAGVPVDVIDVIDDIDVRDALVRIQRDLFALGAQLADPADKIAARVTKAMLGEADVDRLEQLIDRLETELSPLQRFILAGGTEAGAALHLARTVCRRAERRMVALLPAIDPLLLRYINRLSDLLFVMARAVNHRAGVPETEW